MSVDDPDQGTNFAEYGIKVEGRVHEVNLAREIPDLEVHEGATKLSDGQIAKGRVTHCIESFWILAVDSRKRVSFGGILWNTTLEIEDFPLLLIVSSVMIS